MNIFFVPLDERPCNWKYIKMMTHKHNHVKVEMVDQAVLGMQKKHADQDALNQCIKSRVNYVDALVLSLDTFFYGGLIPSRIHSLSREVINKQIDRLCSYKLKNPKLKIYASICIMRSPTYNSSAEEPDYYAVYGRALHRKAYLQDKASRDVLNESEQCELDAISIPSEILKEYEGRRIFNQSVNEEVLQLVKEGIIDFLVIPQDDAAPYGYTALTQRVITSKIAALELENDVNIYPGADEVGSTLVTRAYVDYYAMRPKIYAFYASTLGPAIIPLYEDRPMLETLKYHVRACGASLVQRAEEADFILAINAPGKVMQRAKEQHHNLDVSYTSYRNLNDFVLRIKSYLEDGYPLAVCDSAFGNGGDVSLIKRLDASHLLDTLLSYAGWNTNANTLGTVLADAILHFDQSVSDKKHLLHRYLEDVVYQSIVRQEVLAEVLPALGCEDYHLEKKMSQVCCAVQERLEKVYRTLHLSEKYNVQLTSVSLPWKRLFEVDFEFNMQEKVV